MVLWRGVSWQNVTQQIGGYQFECDKPLYRGMEGSKRQFFPLCTV